MELRYAVGAFVVGAALAAVALAGCNSDEPAGSDGAHESERATASRDLEDYPSCPQRSRSQSLSGAEILDGGHEIRAFYASSSDHRPCGFAFGENGLALAVILQTTDPELVRADLRPRCVDLALPSGLDEDLELVLVPSADGDQALRLDAAAREPLIGHDGCRNVRPLPNASIDVD